ncbi:kinase-like protein [Fomitiporia mediterranea MF3/22]|uniref:kinase-like protein n=1 Tax=Fomitiporia mediterranea (strain MF3/22) TaxID=694068 RepID=UPI00044097F7|nr:kinase-like protein [Fomitiporia mediterranea MF3/22]EJD04735.1 kinase-like protein [Fomitiporia mediterranea MF3/22]
MVSADERPFDVIPFEDIKGNWKKLGSGSFGNVYKGTYLGIEVAIKEVLPSNDYDVAKYFEREWRLMKECRHPNVVLYLGLSRAPEPDGRIFIISEFIENGNLRQYIHDKSKPFPWKLRISFATDIARALAYLHARKCIHRDLKGENLLVTTNGRLKITDFGFARIAARNAEELKRLTFCGTDAYMSPEILIGNEFGLSTDIYSLGIILCEIGARKLADDYTFKRAAPSFGIDINEVRRLVGSSPGCPAAYQQLVLDCLVEDPPRRPDILSILGRLRDIELEVLSRPSEADDVHVGSVKFIAGNKRPPMGPRIPSFGMGVGKDIGRNGQRSSDDSSDDDESSDEEQLIEAIKSLDVDLDGSSQHALLGSHGTHSDYSTTVVRQHPHQATNTVPPSLSSILTIRSPQPTETGQEVLPAADTIKSFDSFHTAASSISIAAATEGSSFETSTIRGAGGPPSTLIHRFTLIKPGVKRQAHSPNARVGSPARDEPSSPSDGQAWSPFSFFFSSTFAAKCDICAKRLGWKPVLECDDCGLRAHIKCGEVAPMDCGLRPARPRVPQTFLPASPLSRAKLAGKSAPNSPSPSPKR